MVAYLIFFVHKIHPQNNFSSSEKRMMIGVLLSFAVIQNFYYGQVEVLLLICAGEFMRAAIKQKPFLGGLWLGFLLIKPQILVLILPALFLLKNWKTILGFLASGLGILAISFMLQGWQGFLSMINLWIKFVPGIASNSPETMMNWRMLGVQLNNLFSTHLGWIVTAVGMAGTLVMVLLLVHKKPAFGSPAWVMAVFGIFAATGAFTWHSHSHLAMIYIPFLLWGLFNQSIQKSLIDLWILLLPTMMFAAILIKALASPFGLQLPSGYGGLMIGGAGLILNLLFLLTAYRFRPENSHVVPQSDMPL